MANHESFIDDQLIRIATYIADEKQTLRSATAKFGVPKSTIHNRIYRRLQGLDEELYARVRVVLEVNDAEKYMRGGNATRLMFQRRAKEKNAAEQG